MADEKHGRNDDAVSGKTLNDNEKLVRLQRIAVGRTETLEAPIYYLPYAGNNVVMSTTLEEKPLI